LEQLKRENKNLDCKKNGNSYRLNQELNLIEDIRSDLDGILWLENLNHVGNTKVGGRSGKNFGDCLHFCMPGPPDDVARALQWMIIGIARNESHDLKHHHRRLNHNFTRDIQRDYHLNVIAIVIFVTALFFYSIKKSFH
jgi:hypothetical protein